MLDYQVDLLDVVLSWEHHVAVHDFSEGAACAPNIDLMAVVVAGEHDLRCSVIPSDDVFCQIFVLLEAQVSAQAKVTTAQQCK